MSLLAVLALVLAGAGLAGWQLWPAKGAPSATPVASAAGSRLAAAAEKPKPAAEPLLAVSRPLGRLTGGITATVGILVDATTGTVLWAKRPHLRRPIASTTKIMTALLAMERLRPKDVVVVDPSATRVQPFKEGLRPNERVPAWKLFYGLLLSSGNDSAVALAVGAGGSRSRFIALMNEKARRLGLKNTHFASPSGLIDEDNYSTAWDLAALTRYALWNPRFRAVVRTKAKRVSWPAPTHAKIYENHNKLLRTYPGADGVKTGWTTRARHCYVASARRNGIRLIAVVLASSDPYGDARRMLDFGFANRG